jgi:hypothetical protein
MARRRLMQSFPGIPARLRFATGRVLTRQGSGIHATFLSQVAFISSGVAGFTLWRHIGGR